MKFEKNSNVIADNRTADIKAKYPVYNVSHPKRNGMTVDRIVRRLKAHEASAARLRLALLAINRKKEATAAPMKRLIHMTLLGMRKTMDIDSMNSTIPIAKNFMFFICQLLEYR